MPLLHITSHTSTEHTFTVAICFLRQETTADYLRAIMELRQMIPGLPAKCVITDAEAVLAAASKAYAPEWKHILCRWHLGQNILTEFKRQMTNNEWKLVLRQWHIIINSASVPQFERSLDEFIKSHRGKRYGQALGEYFRHRLRPGQQEKIVSCHIDQFAHFGQTSTSRAKSGHSQLKSLLNGAHGDLFTVVKIFRCGMYAQQREILQALRKEKFMPRTGLSLTFYREVSDRCVSESAKLTKCLGDVAGGVL